MIPPLHALNCCNLKELYRINVFTDYLSVSALSSFSIN